MCDNKGEWNVYLQGRLKCTFTRENGVATRESGVCSCKGEWSVCVQGIVECMLTRESGVCGNKREWSDAYKGE